MAGAHVGGVTRHVCELCGEGGMEEGELRTHVLLVHVEGLVHHPQVPTHHINRFYFVVFWILAILSKRSLFLRPSRRNSKFQRKPPPPPPKKKNQYMYFVPSSGFEIPKAVLDPNFT
jgi:hypothetical protein